MKGDWNYKRKEMEWAFLDWAGPDGDTLEGRTVIIHVRSASVIEIFSDDDMNIKNLYKVLNNFCEKKSRSEIKETIFKNKNLPASFNRGVKKAGKTDFLLMIVP